MTFRIIKHIEYDKSYCYIQRYSKGIFGYFSGWYTLSERLEGDPDHPGSIETIKFNTEEEAEEYIRRTYTKPIEVVVKKIEI